jgi:hypothetical protein
MTLPTPGRLWWLLRRDWNRGWKAAYHDYRVLPRIAEWRCTASQKNPTSAALHLLTGRNDFLLSAWMLASWFHFTDLLWEVIVHDDGTLPPEGEMLFRKLIPEVKIIRRKEADAEMEKALADFPKCAEYRSRHPLALKIFDAAHFTPHNRLLIFDSDLLFFQTPAAILEHLQSPIGGCWFNEDVSESALVSANEAVEKLGVNAWPRVNSGLCIVEKAAIDFAFCERVFHETGINAGHVWRIEQTLFALCAARFGKGGVLPPDYLVSLERQAAPGVVARHYVGAVRDLFYSDGIARLHPILLPRK